MVLTRLKKALTSSSQSTGSIHIYDTHLVEAPKDIFSGVKGLMAIQPFRREEGQMSFVAYWSSSEAAKLAGPVLQRRLGVPYSIVSGVADELITKPPSRWDKVKDKAVPLLLTTVAVIAALEGLNNRYVALIAAPQFTARFDAPIYNIDEGDAVTASLTVENALTGLELSAINVATKLSDMSGGQPSGSVDMLSLEDVSLPPTKARTYYMSLQNLRAGEHVISADVSAEAGYFRDERIVPANARVIVWPSEAEAFLEYKQTRMNRADFLFTLRVGKIAPSSIVTCDLKFSGTLTQPNNYWRAMGKGSESRWIQGPDSSVLRVTWLAVPGRSTQFAELSLVGGENIDWSKVAADSKPLCSFS